MWIKSVENKLPDGTYLPTPPPLLVSLYRLRSAIFEELWALGATFCCSSNFEQFLPIGAIFEQKIGLEHNHINREKFNENLSLD